MTATFKHDAWRFLTVAMLLAGSSLTACSTQPQPTANADTALPVQSQASALKPVLPAAFEAETPTSALADQTDAGPLSGAEPLELSPSSDLQSDPDSRRLLVWKFTPGDALRYHTSIAERLSAGQKTFDNERHFTSRWQVIDVHPAGRSTLVVTIERVRLHLTYPQLVYDSRYDVAIRSSYDPEAAAELTAAQALLNAQTIVECAPSGLPLRLIDGQVAAGCRFIPADFPILLGEPIGPFDSWNLPTQYGSGASQQDVQCTASVLKREQDVGGRTILVIESQTEFFSVNVIAAGSRAPFRSTAATARFDALRGRFLSRVGTASYSTSSPSGQPVHVQQRVRQQLLGRRGPVER